MGKQIVDLTLERDALRAKVEQRHYVCGAHVPLGEPGNHDDKCPCCEAMQQAAQVARLMEALKGLDEHGLRHDGLEYWKKAYKILADIAKEQKG